jgi:hypothetical protein
MSILSRIKSFFTGSSGATDQYPKETIRSMLGQLGVLDKHIDEFEAALQPGEYIGPKPGTNPNSNAARDLMQVTGKKAKQANDYSYAHSSYCLNIRIKQEARGLPVSAMSDVDEAARSGDYSKIPGA